MKAISITWGARQSRSPVTSGDQCRESGTADGRKRYLTDRPQSEAAIPLP
jgi:hypothetical protein